MKKSAYGFTAFVTLLLFPIWGAAAGKDNLILGVYSTNAEVQLVLSSKDNPGVVLASSRATPSKLYHTVGINSDKDAKMPETRERASMALTGHPPTMKTNDSNLVAFAAALDELKLSAEATWPDLEKNFVLPLTHVVVGIAGYDVYHDGTYKSTNKGAYYRQHVIDILNDRHFTPPGSSENIVITGDHELIARAATQKGQSKSELCDIDFVQLTTYAQAYRIRDCKLVQSSGVIQDSMGGFFSFGRQIQQDYLSALPDDPDKSDFDDPSYADKKPVYDLLNQLHFMRLYENVKLGQPLVVPNIGYDVSGLPTRKNKHYFGRVKSKFKNEVGYLATESITRKSLPSELEVGRPLLQKTAEKTVVAGLVDVVVKLGKSNNFRGDPGPFTLKEANKEVPLILVGEFPLQSLPELKAKVEQDVQAAAPEAAAREFHWVSPNQFARSLSRASALIASEELQK